MTTFTISEFQMFKFQKVGHDHGVQFSHDVIPWLISKSIKVAKCISVLALTVSEILTILVFCLLQKVGQGHGVQFSQWRYSNVNIYKHDFFTVLIFVKIRLVLTIVTDTHTRTHAHVHDTHTYRHTQTHFHTLRHTHTHAYTCRHTQTQTDTDKNGQAHR